MNLHEEEDGCRCECLSREQDGDLKTCVADFIYLFLFSIFCKILAVVCSDLQHKHLQTSPSKDLWMLHLRCAIANACAKKRVGSEQCSHFTPCFSPMLMVPVRECVIVFSQCEEKKQNKKEEKKKRADCPICT